MDKKLLMLMLTAFCCGSIKNSINQPEEYQENLAKEVGNGRPATKHTPYDMTTYQQIGVDHKSSGDDDNGKKLDIV